MLIYPEPPRLRRLLFTLLILLFAVPGVSRGPFRYGSAGAEPLAANCANDSTGLIPLIDLGTGFYQGFEGGLYAGGSNTRPAAHTAAGLAIAQAIGPLDTLGQADPANGRIVLISIGMSNTTMEFQAFVPKANADPAKNPRVLVVDCAVGGQAANLINNPYAAYWDSVTARLRRAGSSRAQVQCVWLKEAIARPTGTFPASADTLQWDLATIVRILKQKLPNLKLTYVTSRIYAGYATTDLNPEPYAYESGFAVKWLIDSQIRGDSLNFDPGHGPVVAPWLSWGPYLWADGMEPRSDGLIWPCSYFSTADGTHPATGARNLVADSLLAFFKSDVTATPWFVGSATAVEEAGWRGGAPVVRASPIPASGTLRIRIQPSDSRSAVWADLFTVSGRLLRQVPIDGGQPGAAGSATMDVSDLPSGVYYLEVRTSAGIGARKVVIAR